MEKKYHHVLTSFERKKSKKSYALLDEIIKTHLSEDLLDVYKIQEHRYEFLKSLLCDQAKQDAAKECQIDVEPYYPTVPVKNVSHEVLWGFANLCPTTPMDRFMEAYLRYTINAHGLEWKYPQLVDSIILEVRQDFLKITHQASVNLKIKPIEGQPTRCIVLPYQRLGRTGRYHKYVKHRGEVRDRWLLYFPLVRDILRQCSTLPEILVDISVFHEAIFDLDELRQTFNQLISQAYKILSNFQVRVVALIENDKTRLNLYMSHHYYKTITGLIAAHVAEAVRRSLLHIVEISGSKNQVPFLQLSIDFENGLKLSPSVNDIIYVYRRLMDMLVDLIGDIETSERVDGKPFRRILIPCYVIEGFVRECADRMAQNLKNLYEPVIEYINELDEKFRAVYGDFGNDGSVMETEMTFIEGCDKIFHYQSYVAKANDIKCNAYFPVGQLIVTDYIESLKQSLATVIEEYFVKLCALHQFENEDLCDQFERIYQYAMKIPDSTEELIEQGKYLVTVKGKILVELKVRIEEMLCNLCLLIDFGNLTKEHMELNATTVHWLSRMGPILEQNSMQFEQLKFEAEELMLATMQDVNTRLEKLIPFLVLLDSMDDADRAKEYLEQFRPMMAELRDLREKIEWINHEEYWLGFQMSEFPLYAQVTNFVYPFYHLVKVCHLLLRKTTAWYDGQFEFLDYASSEALMDDFTKELLKYQKTYRTKIRAAQSLPGELKFGGILDDADMANWPSPIKLATKALATAKNYRPAMTMMRIMCNDALVKRHWREMSAIAGFDLTPNAGTTLRKMLQLGLEPDIERYDVISAGATKERELFQNLQKMLAEWKDINFKVSTYKETNIPILSALDDVQVVLDDHIIKALTMRGSVFVKPYETEVRTFYEKLVRVNDTIDIWGKVQAQWLYLLPIFSSKDIVAQMPEQGLLFKEVNDTYRRYMEIVAQEPKVIESAGAMGVLETMTACYNMLEDINDGVAAYLEKKRLFFPRFFFLSNDEMLEILSETKDPMRVQPHLKKCFEAIDKLNFDKDLNIHHLYSSEGESVKVLQVINTKAAGGSVEKWLVEVEEQMIVSVRDLIVRSAKHYLTLPRTEWIQEWQGQIVLGSSQIHWTQDVHDAINGEQGRTLPIFCKELNIQLHETVALIRSPKLSNLTRITIKALIVIDVHAKDVVEELNKNAVFNDADFKWLSQLRYYMDENNDCQVKIVNATVKYACEYLGNSDRLVITPLTDRCYRTLVGAFHLHLNGAPEGPAGTGKTETTKDLAKALAVQCVVFNCSDGLDYKAMGKFFKGLAASGAWVCFDEFNRIDIEVLSVVAQQILTIVLAVRAHAKTFVFEGTELELNPTCYVCITMNPGYAGRSELPDNLKVLFRTVAMMVPDYAMIGEISLYSYGFVDARNLSVKIVTTYRLCSEQLSSQNHYDYGMRAVKSVLSAAGNNKRKFPDENEDILLLRAILDVNLPKFLSHDLPLFSGIISDLFPGVVLPEADYKTLISAMRHCCKKHRLQPKDSFLLKIIQTYEMMIVRHGFMVVGEPFAGKTSTLKVLADTLTYLNHKKLGEERTVYTILNPKAITMGQLYGQFDPVSYEWFDGVVAKTFRNYAMDPCPDRKWIIFDGPVDAVWIENMNSVLDDNKKLCLMSGEVMSMSNSMSLIFEVMDLEQASPATVSRCGMIYMQPISLGWRPIVDSWLPTCNPEWYTGRHKFISDLFDWLVPPSLTFIRKFCVQFCNPGEITLVNNMMHVFEMYLNTACRNSLMKKEDDAKNMPTWMKASFLLALVWGLAGILDQNSKIKYDEYLRTLWEGENEEYPIPEDIETADFVLPFDGLIIDNCYFFRSRGNWKYWPDIIKVERVDEAPNILQMLVPTVDTARYMQILEMHIHNRVPFLLVGPTGTGKSFYIQDLMLNKLNKELYEPAFITFTVQISANQCQDLVISKLLKKRRGIYGPPKGKTCVMFIDDINMPEKEVYGAQPPIELLRQFFDYANWYDLKTTEPLYMLDVLFSAAMGLVGGSRQEIYARFLRHFSIISINEFSQETMAKIFTNILHVGLKNNGFPSDVIMTVVLTVAASLEIYKQAIENLRPTPSKSHYVFNLRDLSRLIQGCAMLRKDSVDDSNAKKIFPRLWVHEVFRVFYDRLVEQKDKNWLFETVKMLVKDNFKDHFEMIFDHLPLEDEIITQKSMRSLMFGSYFDQDAPESEKKYEETASIQIFLNLAQACLEEYNNTKKNKMDIVLFDYALEHLSKICRVLTMACGSALLVGISGSGRQSLTRLAAEMYGQRLFQPEITNNYGLMEWRDDIKKTLRESGGLGKGCVFLIGESQIKEEYFLQDVDCLLNSGEVPNMYAIDEKQEILDMVRLAAQGGNRNLDISPLSIFFFFTRRCREKLHIILCFSPVGATFRTRLRLFPSLINCCTIDWFEDWPETALAEVAEIWMVEVNLPDDVKHNAVMACKYFHVKAREGAAQFFEELGRKMYITSASYLGLIKSFTILTNSKQREIMKAKSRYVGGLEKLEHAASSIAEMQITLAELQPKLKESSQKATEMATKIATEAKSVEIASQLVKQDEIQANKQAAVAEQLKKECEADLAEVRPIFEGAQEALKTLKPADITLVKSMKNPPSTVKLIMEAVCILKDVKPLRKPDPATGKMVLDYWQPSVKLLSDMNFLSSLQNYDVNNIRQDLMNRIRKEYIPHKDFKPEIVAKASSAAEGLCKWILAVEMYDNVYKIVKPKQEKLDKAQRELDETMAFLLAKKKEVMKLESELAILMEKLEDANQTMANLQASVDLCNDKLIRAQKLIGGLGGEKTRWTLISEQLQLQYDGLAGDLLISCGIIAYLSPMNALFRQNIIKDWHIETKRLDIPCADEYDLAIVLGSDVTIQNWNIFGLPRDQFSTENGIIQDCSRRWSLFIDPQCQASNWIKKMERQNELKILKFTYSDYMKRIEQCITLGQPVLIESIEENLEAALDPVLSRNTFKQAGVEVIAIGENLVTYNKNFKLYMCSKLRNPHYLPEVYNKVTIINFALTVEGLEDQLLGIVVAVEKPDLQQLKEELIVQKAENRAALLNVETNILRTLSETKGDILEDEGAIQILDESKILSVEINQKQLVSLEIEKNIEEFRIKYQGVAKHGAVLYYCISDLANIDPMYQYSLDWFINLYVTSIQKAENFRQLEKRCQSLIKAFTYDLYSNITRSLFEKDKLLFSFLLCSKIMIFHKDLTEEGLRFLLTGGVGVENPIPNPTNWLPSKSWDEICRVDCLPPFKAFKKHFEQNIEDWKVIYDSNNPQKEKLPEPWESQLNGFRKLIVYRLLRPDTIIVAVTEFLRVQMDDRFITPPQFNIAVSYNDSYCLCPLIFILSPGVDPMGALVKFAEDRKFLDRFTSISLGQGQGPIAQNLIETAQIEGNWVCLQNCHLATSWMPTLEKIFELLDYSNTHDHFRLWLTSYPSDKFPVTLLQRGVKMTNEPPTGLQQNLLKSYITEPVKNPEFYSGCPGKEDMFARMLFGLAFFHAVVQERRTFGPLGWNIPYGFNDSDYDISVKQLQMFINESEDPFEAVSYLIGECNYGGRVTDDWDRRLIVTVLADYINRNLAFDNKYVFSTAGDCYGLPNKSGYQDYVAHINSMPQHHPPEVFGLHRNAGISRDLQNSNLLLASTLKVCGEGAGGGGGGDSDKYLNQLTLDILAKLPKKFDLEQATKKYPVTYQESMNTVLVQEMERFNKLLGVITGSLNTVQRAIQGLVAMSPSLEAFCTSLLLSRIPASWVGVSYPSLKNLPNYVADFVRRIDFLRLWYDEGKPSSYWVSGFFFTQAFLTGVKQNFARKYTIPIDKLTFDYEVMIKEPIGAPVDGAYIYGFFMDGARWNRQERFIEELLPKILFDELPSVWIIPIETHKLDPRGRYNCPVYKTSARRGVLSTTGHSTNYVLPLMLETRHPIAHWIKRSVALLCQLD